MQATFVVPWYGRGIPGGAEAEARRTAENLAAAGVKVRVLTTRLPGLGADWGKDLLPAGESEENGIKITRFEPLPQNGQIFDNLNRRVLAGEKLTPAQEEDFFANMVNSSELFSHVAENPHLGPFFFIPYLFTTSVWGPQIHPSKSVIIPCLHDEGYARMSSVRQAFESARAVVFHVPAEMKLAAGLYDLHRTEPLVLGEGIDTGWEADGRRFREKYKLDGPFILYAGRKDAGKNVPLLVQYFNRYVQDRQGAGGLKLILIGNLSINIPYTMQNHIIDLGFVPKQDKYDAYAAADVLVQPSLMESFSIVIMESWLAGTPVMVHSGCAVTREHVENSRGGLHFFDYPRFAEALEMMLSDAGLREAMSRAGRKYVLDNYTWPQVTQRFVELIERLSREPCPRPRSWKGVAPKVLTSFTPSSKPAVHQFVTSLSYGDAIGGDVMAIQKAVQSWGIDSEVFAYGIHPRLQGLARPHTEITKIVRPRDILLFHFSIGHEICQQVPEMPGRKVMRYHNITPARYLQACNPESAHWAEEGRRQLAELAPQMELGLGVSEYNSQELLEAGCPKAGVVPILLDLDVLKTQPDPLTLQIYGTARPTVLHVGRIVPNKCIEDLIKVQYWLDRLVEGSRLVMVGSDGGWRPYSDGLKKLILKLGVQGAIFAGHVSYPELMAYYRAAEAYLCLSEHEGFCVPLVESMYFGLPIVAYESTGVTGTLDGGGILLKKKDPLFIAETLAVLLTRSDIRERFRGLSRNRLERFRPERVALELKDTLVREMGLELPR